MISYTIKELWKFVKESNEVENIDRDPYTAELQVHGDFFALKRVEVRDVENLVKVLCGAPMRDQRGRDVMIRGDAHKPPPGDPSIRTQLVKLLNTAGHEPVHPSWNHPHAIHQLYENLHPFLDGNGRSGRALWAHQMLHQGWEGGWGLRFGFLRAFYYQTLKQGRL